MVGSIGTEINGPIVAGINNPIVKGMNNSKTARSTGTWMDGPISLEIEKSHWH